MWLIINLLLTCFCGTCLGLLISAYVDRSDRAVYMVPLVILPQIIFSEFAIDEDQFEGASEVIYQLMPSRWGFESLICFSKTEPDFFAAVGNLFPLLIFSGVFLLLCYPILRVQRY